jgi:Mce-associated membrane protein
MTTPRNSTRITLWLSVFVILALGIVGATTVGVWKLVTNHDVAAVVEQRVPREQVAPADDPADRKAVLASVKDSAAKVLTYSAATIDADIAAGAAVTTGEFRDYYRDFTKQVVIPAAREKGVSTTAEVVGAGVVSLDEDQAVILVFVNQSTTSRAEPEPRESSSAVRVGLTRADDAWLIEQFQPV